MEKKPEAPGRDFHHPYTPYDIQNDFMNALYDCIENGGVGIFESPTGTGKSLSLICGSLTWLRNHKREDLREQAERNEEGAGDEPAWMIEHATQQKRQAILQRRAELEDRLVRIRAREKRQKEQYEKGEPNSKKHKIGGETPVADEDDASFLLDDYESDEEQATKSSTLPDGLSAATQGLMKRLGMNMSGSDEGDAEIEDELKIFYCSRTHSQLSQFVNELRRVRLPHAIPSQNPEIEQAPGKILQVEIEEEIKHLSLGSRRNLCINPKVSSLKSANAINERCLELQKPGTPGDCKCSYLPTRENQAIVNSFRDHALARIRDIEDLCKLGKTLEICPYYATRSTIRPSEIVTLPYPLLLQKAAREALGLSLKGQVVIIDEAHNLMDAITNLYSISVSLKQLKTARTQLGIYLQKFRNRLKGKNRVYVTQIVRLLDSLIAYMHGKLSDGRKADIIVDLGELMAGKGVDQINLYKLMHYLQESKLARKVDGYAAHAEQQDPGKRGNGRPSNAFRASDVKNHDNNAPVLTQFHGFLQALTNLSAEGRIFFERTEDNDACLEYMLLDPTHHFRDIVEEARAVILAGGTMSPMSDYGNHLLAYVPPERIKTLSCGHVIPADNLLAWPISKGPSGVDFEFTFEQRTSKIMIDELGRAILNLCLAIPDGVVVFFSSYAYLELVTQHWQKGSRHGSPSMWERLSQRKQVFRETKESGGVEAILQEYSTAIDAGKGGLLFSVIGGKMSEGINFSDKLGRGVMVVGLPFPNINSAEWKAKLEYVENAVFERQQTTGSEVPETLARARAKAAGREFYENACMRAVNQSIGRAIRHQNDYATIILLDKRFDSQRVRNKLPAWIQNGLVNEASSKPFSELMKSLFLFFRSKKTS